MDQEKTEYMYDDVAHNSDTILKDSDIKAEPILNQKNQEDHVFLGGKTYYGEILSLLLNIISFKKKKKYFKN
jgi:hypothetical protein